MTTIKSPQTVSHVKSNGNHGGHGFITLLLLITWLAVGAVFYGVKSGMLQPEEVSPTITEKLAKLEGTVSSLDARLKNLESKLAEASSALNPTGAPTDIIKPEEEVKPAAPMMMKPEETKKPEGGAVMTPPAEPMLAEPKEEEKPKMPEDKTGAAPTKPQTNNKDKTDGADQTSLTEKKSYI